MRAFIIFIVTFFVSFVLFLICSMILAPVFENVASITNSTLPGTQYPAIMNDFLFGTLQKVFGVFCVVSIIGIIVAYALDTHRREGEEFEYYNKYR